MTQNNGISWDAEHYDRGFGFITKGGEPLLEWLMAMRGTAQERVLDLGCGTGRLTSQLAERGFRVAGLDVSPTMIARARANYPALRFTQADASDFHLPTPVRWVISNAALHWMKNAPAVLNSVHRALEPGGGFLGELGAAGNIAAITEGLYAALEEVGIPGRAVEFPWFFPSLEEYVDLLESAGFEVQRAETFARPSRLDDCPNGIKDWVMMFGEAFLKPVPPSARGRFLEAVERHCAPRLLRNGRWYADYRRLRFFALRPAE